MSADGWVTKLKPGVSRINLPSSHVASHNGTFKALFLLIPCFFNPSAVS